MNRYLITGKRLALRKLSRKDVNDTYLSWLNDPAVQEFTSRRGRTVTMRELENFAFAAEQGEDWHLAIIKLSDNKHVGNVSIVRSIHDDPASDSRELTIMIGDRGEWGQGLASEAIRLATKLAFANFSKLHRLWAQSANPAFNNLIAKMGWTREGVHREAFKTKEQYLNITFWSILREEWKERSED